MPHVLILSSLVAGSRVGGRVSAAALEARGIDTSFCPTVLMGRHPGHGKPGGGPVPDEQFGAMLEGLAAHGLFGLFDAVLTGYFASAGQVEIAAAAIAEIRKAPRRRGDAKAFSERPLIVIDPIIGDRGALYVDDRVANAVRDQLVPLADIITPNAFELGWLAGQPVDSPAGFLSAANRAAPVTFMTSARFGDRFGTAYHASGHAALAAHAELETVPNGTGDLFAGELLGELILGTAPGDAFETAVRHTLDAALKARDWNAFELPDISARRHKLHAEAVIDLQPLKA
ncbi:bifunctional hydroxymethylpyrimidine kinase/phosphomethylpyrimidine kinase [Hyphobacterium sp.]|uniref:bifunctional hydroxymethylpyrimidine kinase/phosphomethylpyrimidine kinase n=1 Tax=Hyphobacterium sp. TaxID=2004662 RepID=UPI003BA9F857